MTTDELTTQALALPFEQRMQLAQRLWQSLAPPGKNDDEETILELVKKRSAELDTGVVETIPHEEMIKRLRGRLKLN